MKRCFSLLPHLINLLALGILTARIDFFPDWFYAREIQLSSRDRSFDIVFSAEKVLLLPLVLLSVRALYGLYRAHHKGFTLAGSVFLPTLLGVVALVGPALLTKHVAVEPKFPEITWVWMIHNLVFVCILEELLFRNYIYEGIYRRLANRSIAYSVVLSSILFGAYHFRGGAVMVGLASIAGAVYVMAYRRGGLVAAILTHFAVNLVHFLVFSYPSLQKFSSFWFSSLSCLT